jgi:hypothetical protein
MNNLSSNYIKHRCSWDGTFFSAVTIAASAAAFSSATAGIGALCLPATAAVAGGPLAVMGASATGGAFLWGIPTYLHRCMQNEIHLNKDLNTFHQVAFCGIVLLTAAFGALSTEVAIMPVLTCAFVGLALANLVDLFASYIGNTVDCTSTLSNSA